MGGAAAAERLHIPANTACSALPQRVVLPTWWSLSTALADSLVHIYCPLPHLLQFIDEPPAPSYCADPSKYALPDTQPIDRPDAVITLQVRAGC